MGGTLRSFKRYLLIHTGDNIIDEQNLQLHMLIHTGDKPYKCKMCDKKTRNCSLKQHIHVIKHTHVNCAMKSSHQEIT